MMGLYRLRKKERLSGKKRIEKLFQEGISVYCFPFRVVWLLSDRISGNSLARITIAVSRKNFRNAVDRNLIKRRIREAYRRNKYILTEWLDKDSLTLDVAFIYTASQILSYRDIEEKIIVALHKIIEVNEKVTD
ncbi:MAG TPA: ribonuclease P protein component [Bacteroidetes bacterium]|nr:ribonuclease P protein component [Bacteroidota bacterium]